MTASITLLQKQSKGQLSPMDLRLLTLSSNTLWPTRKKQFQNIFERINILILIYCIYGCKCSTCLNVKHICDWTYKDLYRASDPLEQELQTIVGCYLHTGIQTWVVWKRSCIRFFLWCLQPDTKSWHGDVLLVMTVRTSLNLFLDSSYNLH